MLASLLAVVSPPRCLACTRPIGAGRRLCPPCHGALPWLEDDERSPAWAPVAFDGPARELVHALKFRGRTAAADIMASQIAANAPAGLLEDGVLVPVPAHPANVRSRGFDQARLLARRLSARTGLRVAPVLVRHGRARQLGSGRARRLSQDLGVAAVRGVAGRAVLVDDVHTTGATLTACAGALRHAGASEVVAVTYARTL